MLLRDSVWVIIELVLTFWTCTYRGNGETKCSLNLTGFKSLGVNHKRVMNFELFQLILTMWQNIDVYTFVFIVFRELFEINFAVIVRTNSWVCDQSGGQQGTSFVSGTGNAYGILNIINEPVLEYMGSKTFIYVLTRLHP